MIFKGNLSIEELNTIKILKEKMYGLDAVHIHNAFVIGELLLKRKFSYEEIFDSIKENNLDSSTDRTVNTTFRLNQKAYEVLEDYADKTKCSKISIIRAIIFLFSSPKKQNNHIAQLKIVSVNVNSFGNLEVKPVYKNNASYEEKQQYSILKKKWDSNTNISNRILLAERLTKWLIINQIDVIILNEYDVSVYKYNGENIKVSNYFKHKLEDYYYTDKELSFPKDSEGNTYKSTGSICACFISKQICKENFKILAAPTLNLKATEWPYTRWLGIELNINEKKIILIGVHIPYGNNDRAKNYWKILLNYCEKYYKTHMNYQLIILGDFNAFTNNDISEDNTQSENASKLTSLDKYLKDAYREVHPYTPCYSYVKNVSPRRLDYIFVSENALKHINQVEYLHNINSSYTTEGFTDHSGLLININI